MIILLGSYSAEVERECIFKLTVGSGSVHEISYDIGVSVVNFATSKNLIVKNMSFAHCNIARIPETCIQA